MSLYAVKPGMCLIIDGYECPEYQRYFRGSTYGELQKLLEYLQDT